MVHPDYRGNNLQSITLNKALPLISEMGYIHIFSTVSPQNIYSLYNIMKNGLNIKSLKRKYITKENSEGLWRFILHRNLKESPIYLPNNMKSLEIHSYEEQEYLISKGYIGHKLCRDNMLIDYSLKI